jgi:hypothetical protein
MAMRWITLACMAAMLVMLAACSSDLLSSDDEYIPGDPTTRAMADPMGYSPAEHEDIAGGGLTDFNSDAFKKDMNHVLNP